MKSSAPSITSIFYLTLACLTLLAAARQWLPQEGFSPQLNLGVKEARAQSPGAFIPAPPANFSAAPTTGAPTTATPPTQAVGPTSMAPPFAPVAAAPAAPYAAAGPAVPYPTQQPPTVGVVSTNLQTFNSTAATSEPPPIELEETRVVARVGGEVILAGDVSSSVNTALARNGFDPKDPQIAAQKGQYFQMRLKQLIETRIILNEARRKIPAEGMKRATEVFDEEFNQNIVPKMLADRKAADLPALEEQLKREGSTLEKERAAFAESVLTNSWLKQNIKVNEDVPQQEMLAYYQSHSAAYEFLAQARWEQITTRFDSFPTKADAYAALAAAGNKLVDGTPFHQVARECSQGSTASQGGSHPWTKQGSLVSKPLDAALFSLPVNTFSPIIEDDKGFHIIRVLERIDAGKVPFAEAQNAIRQKILAERTEKARKDFLTELKANTSVWTIFDDPKSQPEGTAAYPTKYR